MIFTIIISSIALISMILLIIFLPQIKIFGRNFDTFYIPILIAAIIFLITPYLDNKLLFDILTSNTQINPLKIIVLFISVSFISITLDESGFLSYIANVFITKYKASQMKLFIGIYILSSILTVFTSNDIVILTFTPFILYFSKKGKINPIPYLVMEFVAANTWSMLLSIGNPTNIYLSSVFEISFLDYFIKMIIPTIITGIFSFIILFILFRKQLKKEIEPFDNKENKINDKLLCIISLIHLSITIILLSIANYINIESYLVTLILGSSLLIFLIIYAIIRKKSRIVVAPLRRIPYTIIPFILSMFVIIITLKEYHIFENINKLFNQIENEKLRSMMFLFTSILSCNFLNNIPMTLAYSCILDGSSLSSIYATIIGSNLGAILTPIGALAGIMWIRILKINDINYSFKDFIKNGFIILLFTLIGTTISILII